MSGDPAPIIIIAERDTVLARAIEALARFPTDQSWVLVGGIAVFLRLGWITRPTADVDTVARSQAALLDQLIADEPTTIISGGEIEMPVGGGIVQIDVMDLNDDPLPGDLERRAFALARRQALDAASPQDVAVTDAAGSSVARSNVFLSSAAALVSLKTVAMVRRPHGNHPEKVGSDIHDLVRLVSATGARAIATELAAGDPELAAWVADQITRSFAADLRYTLVRLRTHDRSASSQALSDDDVAATVILGDALHELLAERDGERT